MQVAVMDQVGNHSDAEYDGFRARLAARFKALSKGGEEPLFTTDSPDLWDVYLAAFPEIGRQHHNCNACRDFIRRHGGLVTIGEDGATVPVMWDPDDATPENRGAIAALARAVRSAPVNGVFFSAERGWGLPVTGMWTHMAVTHEKPFAHPLLSASQKMAEKLEDYRTVCRAMADFKGPMLDMAVSLLKSDALYRSEKVLGQAEWLKALYDARLAAKGVRASNVTWRMVAMAPAGFCHPRSSMIGTLLEDIADGMSFEAVAARFKAKMHPLQYQRPQAAPAAGAIAQAEKIVAKLGAEGAFRRRFARLDEVQMVWSPKPDAPRKEGAGFFAHLQPKGEGWTVPTMQVPPQVITWEKFSRTVLPTAERMEVLAPAVGTYTALVTAVDPNAPPIFQWDRDGRRNPVSWYVYNGGSTAGSWGLTSQTYHKVVGISLKPSMWHGGVDHQGTGAVFLIEGAKDSRRVSLALFPECLRSEYHGIRSVIEAHSRGGKLEPVDGPVAAGLLFPGGQVALRVWSGASSLDYKLDRWD